MMSVHHDTKRRADVGDRYRLTRISFDVISALGCLQARGLPGPVVVAVLAEHGYSSSSVHNQLVRMVRRGILTSERIGRVSVYRMSERILSGFMDIAGEGEAPQFHGRFHSVVYSIPETARILRDRFQYVARVLGYRQLRPGIMIAFADRSAELSAQLPAIEDPGWSEFVTLDPGDDAVARRMTSLAFDLDSAAEQVPSLEERMDELSLGGRAPGAGHVNMPMHKFFDLYFEVARAVMSHPMLPEVLVVGEQPAVRFRELMDRCNLEYYLRFDQQILECAGASSSFDLIEWLPERGTSAVAEP